MWQLRVGGKRCSLNGTKFHDLWFKLFEHGSKNLMRISVSKSSFDVFLILNLICLQAIHFHFKIYVVWDEKNLRKVIFVSSILMLAFELLFLKYNKYVKLHNYLINILTFSICLFSNNNRRKICRQPRVR